MKKKKHILLWIIAAVVVISVISPSKDSSESKRNRNTEQPQEVKEAAQSEEPAFTAKSQEKETDKPGSSLQDIKDAVNDLKSTTDEFKDAFGEAKDELSEVAEAAGLISKTGAVEIAEQVIADEKGIKVTAKGYDAKGSIFGPSVMLLIENNSGKSLTFQTRNSSVNGYMIQTSMSEDVADGKKTNTALAFFSSDMDECGITDPAEFEFSLHVFTSDDWKDYYDSPQIIIKNEAAQGYVQEYDDSGIAIYDKNGIRVIARGMGNSLLGDELGIYIENNSSVPVTVQANDCSVNGFMVDTIFSADVFPGKKTVDGLVFMSSDLEKNGIESFDEIELSLNIFNSDNWKTIEKTKPIKIDLKAH